MNDNDKEIYVIDLCFSKMRFLEDNSSVNTTIFQPYALISLTKKELNEIYPDILKEFLNFIKKYTEKHPFINNK